MNMQAMLKQAQKLQKEMLETQEKINAMEFIGKSSIVTVKMNGKKELLEVKIDIEEVEIINSFEYKDITSILANNFIGFSKSSILSYLNILSIDNKNYTLSDLEKRISKLENELRK